MTPNLQMEQFSLAVIRAVAAAAGYHVARSETDIDSVDGVLMARFGRRPRIEFQAMATSRDIRLGDQLRFPIPVRNYDELRSESWAPRILIVALMPSASEPWLSESDDGLYLHSSIYWVSLAGLPPAPNTASVTISIPTANVFNQKQLTDLMARAEAGSPL